MATKRSKTIFLIVSGLFLITMVIIGWDISRQTTFPGRKGQLKERMKKELEKNDEAKAEDSVKVNTKKND